MRVVLISSVLPETHYSQCLAKALHKTNDFELIIYADRSPENLEIEHIGHVKAIWRKSIFYVLDILNEIGSDRPDVVHLQHEFNMYGGLGSAVFFPLLLFLLRTRGYKVVVTVHAVVEKKIITKSFLSLFSKSKLMVPFFVRMAFSFIYFSIGRLASHVIVHTTSLKTSYITDYGIKPGKISVIPIGVEEIKAPTVTKENFFLYFGYITKRKGLQYVIEGFAKFIENSSNKNTRLVLAGGCIPGQEFALYEINQLIENIELQDYVQTTGFISRSELDDLFLKAKAVVIPAEITIAGSNPLSQALSHSKCILASKVGCLAEEIDHGINGFLVNNNAWEKAFSFVITQPEQVLLIEKNAYKKAQDRTWEKVKNMHISVFQKTANNT